MPKIELIENLTARCNVLELSKFKGEMSQNSKFGVQCDRPSKVSVRKMDLSLTIISGIHAYLQFYGFPVAEKYNQFYYMHTYIR